MSRGSHRTQTCEVCSTEFRRGGGMPQRTCSRACGVILKGHTPGGSRSLSLRDLNAPLTKERSWITAHRKQKNRDYARTYMLNRFRTNPAVRDQMRNNAARRAAKLRGADRIDPISLDQIAERDGHRCHICGKQVADNQRSLDHLIPISKGGQHVLENVALAHLSCNSRRHDGRLAAQLLLVG